MDDFTGKLTITIELDLIDADVDYIESNIEEFINSRGKIWQNNIPEVRVSAQRFESPATAVIEFRDGKYIIPDSTT